MGVSKPAGFYPQMGEMFLTIAEYTEGFLAFNENNDKKSIGYTAKIIVQKRNILAAITEYLGETRHFRRFPENRRPSGEMAGFQPPAGTLMWQFNKPLEPGF